MTPDNYVQSLPYEGYIKLARKCSYEEHGARNYYMQVVMNEEIRPTMTPAKKRDAIKYVKSHIISAAKFALKRKIAKVDKEIIKSHPQRIVEAENAAALLKICKEGREIFLRYKEHSTTFSTDN